MPRPLKPLQPLRPISYVDPVAPLQAADMVTPLKPLTVNSPFAKKQKSDEYLRNPFEVDSLTDVLFNNEGKYRTVLHDTGVDIKAMDPVSGWISGVILGGMHYVNEQFAKPLIDKDYGQLFGNALGSLMEDVDVFANPVKGAVMEIDNPKLAAIVGGVAALGAGALTIATGGAFGLGLVAQAVTAAGVAGGISALGTAVLTDPLDAIKGFEKGFGYGSQGKTQYYPDTGNILSDIAIEMALDPLNWGSAAGDLALKFSRRLNLGFDRNTFRYLFKLADVDKIVTSTMFYGNPIGATFAGVRWASQAGGSLFTKQAKSIVSEIMEKGSKAGFDELSNLFVKSDEVMDNAAKEVMGKYRHGELAFITNKNSEGMRGWFLKYYNGLKTLFKSDPDVTFEGLKEIAKSALLDTDHSHLLKYVGGDADVLQAAIRDFLVEAGATRGVASSLKAAKYLPTLDAVDELMDILVEQAKAYDVTKELLNLQFDDLLKKVSKKANTFAPDANGVVVYHSYIAAMHSELLTRFPELAELLNTGKYSPSNNPLLAYIAAAIEKQGLGLTWDDLVDYHHLGAIDLATSAEEALRQEAYRAKSTRYRLATESFDDMAQDVGVSLTRADSELSRLNSPVNLLYGTLQDEATYSVREAIKENGPGIPEGWDETFSSFKITTLVEERIRRQMTSAVPDPIHQGPIDLFINEMRKDGPLNQAIQDFTNFDNAKASFPMLNDEELNMLSTTLGKLNNGLNALTNFIRMDEYARVYTDTKALVGTDDLDENTFKELFPYEAQNPAKVITDFYMYFMRFPKDRWEKLILKIPDNGLRNVLRSVNNHMPSFGFREVIVTDLASKGVYYPAQINKVDANDYVISSWAVPNKTTGKTMLDLIDELTNPESWLGQLMTVVSQIDTKYIGKLDGFSDKAKRVFQLVKSSQYAINYLGNITNLVNSKVGVDLNGPVIQKMGAPAAIVDAGNDTGIIVAQPLNVTGKTAQDMLLNMEQKEAIDLSDKVLADPVEVTKMSEGLEAISDREATNKRVEEQYDATVAQLKFLRDSKVADLTAADQEYMEIEDLYRKQAGYLEKETEIVKEIKEYEEWLGEVESKLSVVNTAAIQAQKGLDRMKADAQTSGADLTVYEKKAADLLKEREELTKEYAKISIEIVDIKSVLDTVRLDIADTEKTLTVQENLAGKITKAEEKITALRDEINNSLIELQAAREQLSNMASDLTYKTQADAIKKIESLASKAVGKSYMDLLRAQSQAEVLLNSNLANSFDPATVEAYDTLDTKYEHILGDYMSSKIDALVNFTETHTYGVDKTGVAEQEVRDVFRIPKGVNIKEGLGEMRFFGNEPTDSEGFSYPNVEEYLYFKELETMIEPFVRHLSGTEGRGEVFIYNAKRAYFSNLKKDYFQFDKKIPKANRDNALRVMFIADPVAAEAYAEALKTKAEVIKFDSEPHFGTKDAPAYKFGKFQVGSLETAYLAELYGGMGMLLKEAGMPVDELKKFMSGAKLSDQVRVDNPFNAKGKSELLIARNGVIAPSSRLMKKLTMGKNYRKLESRRLPAMLRAIRQFFGNNQPEIKAIREQLLNTSLSQPVVVDMLDNGLFDKDMFDAAMTLYRNELLSANADSIGGKTVMKLEEAQQLIPFVHERAVFTRKHKAALTRELFVQYLGRNSRMFQYALLLGPQQMGQMFSEDIVQSMNMLTLFFPKRELRMGKFMEPYQEIVWDNDIMTKYELANSSKILMNEPARMFKRVVAHYSPLGRIVMNQNALMKRNGSSSEVEKFISAITIKDPKWRTTSADDAKVIIIDEFGNEYKGLAPVEPRKTISKLEGSEIDAEADFVSENYLPPEEYTLLKKENRALAKRKNNYTQVTVGEHTIGLATQIPPALTFPKDTLIKYPQIDTFTLAKDTVKSAGVNVEKGSHRLFKGRIMATAALQVRNQRFIASLDTRTAKVKGRKNSLSGFRVSMNQNSGSVILIEEDAGLRGHGSRDFDKTVSYIVDMISKEKKVVAGFVGSTYGAALAEAYRKYPHLRHNMRLYIQQAKVRPISNNLDFVLKPTTMDASMKNVFLLPAADVTDYEVIKQTIVDLNLQGEEIPLRSAVGRAYRTYKMAKGDKKQLKGLMTWSKNSQDRSVVMQALDYFIEKDRSTLELAESETKSAVVTAKPKEVAKETPDFTPAYTERRRTVDGDAVVVYKHDHEKIRESLRADLTKAEELMQGELFQKEVTSTVVPTVESDEVEAQQALSRKKLADAIDQLGPTTLTAKEAVERVTKKYIIEALGTTDVSEYTKKEANGLIKYVKRAYDNYLDKKERLRFDAALAKAKSARGDVSVESYEKAQKAYDEYEAYPFKEGGPLEYLKTDRTPTAPQEITKIVSKDVGRELRNGAEYVFYLYANRNDVNSWSHQELIKRMGPYLVQPVKNKFINKAGIQVTKDTYSYRPMSWSMSGPQRREYMKTVSEKDFFDWIENEFIVYRGRDNKNKVMHKVDFKNQMDEGEALMKKDGTITPQYYDAMGKKISPAKRNSKAAKELYRTRNENTLTANVSFHSLYEFVEGKVTTEKIKNLTFKEFEEKFMNGRVVYKKAFTTTKFKDGTKGAFQSTKDGYDLDFEFHIMPEAQLVVPYREKVGVVPSLEINTRKPFEQIDPEIKTPHQKIVLPEELNGFREDKDIDKVFQEGGKGSDMDLVRKLKDFKDKKMEAFYEDRDRVAKVLPQLHKAHYEKVVRELPKLRPHRSLKSVPFGQEVVDAKAYNAPVDGFPLKTVDDQRAIDTPFTLNSGSSVAVVGSRRLAGDLVMESRLDTVIEALNGRDIKVRSGGAIGPDSRVTLNAKNKEIYTAEETGIEGEIIAPELDSFGVAQDLASKLHPAWDRLDERARNLHTRNMYQVLGLDLNSPSEMVIVAVMDETGGTQQAINAAKERGIPVFNVMDDVQYEELKKILGINKTKRTVVSSFRGDYAFLSNFYDAKIEIDGVEYPTTEHAYHAMKATNKKERLKISKLPTPGEAKKYSRTIKIVKDWDTKRLEVMERVLKKKFADPVLKQKLLDTGSAELIEGNTWGDKFWGKVNGEGENNLGKLLMNLRDDLADPQGLFPTTVEEIESVKKPITTPERITELKPGQVFVFGSNLAGIHGAGAAKQAKNDFGAVAGVGEGPTGQTYALPTKDKDIKSRSLDEIMDSIAKFRDYAIAHPELEFLVTAVGTGLAGYSKAQIKKLFDTFKHSWPSNVIMPDWGVEDGVDSYDKPEAILESYKRYETREEYSERVKQSIIEKLKKDAEENQGFDPTEVQDAIAKIDKIFPELELTKMSLAEQIEYLKHPQYSEDLAAKRTSRIERNTEMNAELSEVINDRKSKMEVYTDFMRERIRELQGLKATQEKMTKEAGAKPSVEKLNTSKEVANLRYTRKLARKEEINERFRTLTKDLHANNVALNKAKYVNQNAAGSISKYENAYRTNQDEANKLFQDQMDLKRFIRNSKRRLEYHEKTLPTTLNREALRSKYADLSNERARLRKEIKDLDNTLEHFTKRRAGRMYEIRKDWYNGLFGSDEATPWEYINKVQDGKLTPLEASLLKLKADGYMDEITGQVRLSRRFMQGGSQRVSKELQPVDVIKDPIKRSHLRHQLANIVETLSEMPVGEAAKILTPEFLMARFEAFGMLEMTNPVIVQEAIAIINDYVEAMKSIDPLARFFRLADEEVHGLLRDFLERDLMTFIKEINKDDVKLAAMLTKFDRDYVDPYAKRHFEKDELGNTVVIRSVLDQIPDVSTRLEGMEAAASDTVIASGHLNEFFKDAIGYGVNTFKNSPYFKRIFDFADRNAHGKVFSDQRVEDFKRLRDMGHNIATPASLDAITLRVRAERLDADPNNYDLEIKTMQDELDMRTALMTGDYSKIGAKNIADILTQSQLASTKVLSLLKDAFEVLTLYGGDKGVAEFTSKAGIGSGYAHGAKLLAMMNADSLATMVYHYGAANTLIISKRVFNGAFSISVLEEAFVKYGVDMIEDDLNYVFKGARQIPDNVKKFEGVVRQTRNYLPVEVTAALDPLFKEMNLALDAPYPFHYTDVLPVKVNGDLMADYAIAHGYIDEADRDAYVVDLQTFKNAKYPVFTDFEGFKEIIGDKTVGSPMRIIANAAFSIVTHTASKNQFVEMFFDETYMVKKLASNVGGAEQIMDRLDRAPGMRMVFLTPSYKVIDIPYDSKLSKNKKLKLIELAMSKDAIFGTAEMISQARSVLHSNQLPWIMEQLAKYVGGIGKAAGLMNIGSMVRNALDNSIKYNLAFDDPKMVESIKMFYSMIDDYEAHLRKMFDMTADEKKIYLDSLTESQHVLFRVVQTMQHSTSAQHLVQMIYDINAAVKIGKGGRVQVVDQDMFTKIIWGNPAMSFVLGGIGLAETAARGGMMVQGLLEGMGGVEVTKLINDTFFDYNQKSSMIRAMEIVFPFTFFPLKNLLYWADKATKKPWLMRLMLQAGTQTWVDEEQKRKRELSDWEKRQRDSGNFKIGNLLVKANPSFFDAMNMIPGLLTDPTSRLNPVIKSVEKLLSGDIDGLGITLPYSTQYNRAVKMITQTMPMIAGGEMNQIPNMVPSLFSYQEPPTFYNNQRVIGGYNNISRNGIYAANRLLRSSNFNRKVYLSRGFYKQLYTSTGNSRIKIRATTKPSSRNLAARMQDQNFRFK